MERERAFERVRDLIEPLLQEPDDNVRLKDPTFGTDEIMEALDSLVGRQVTCGDKTRRFERAWSDYVGVESSVMVNSGSSANLLGMKSLRKTAIDEGDEVILPAVCWSTSLFPILDIDAKPVFVDVDRETLGMDVESLNEAITEDTAAVMPIHLLGNPVQMDALMELAEDHDLAVLEDCCQAHGAEYDGRKVGSFGDIGTFSFYFTHHITTMEGGMLVTDEESHADNARMMRSWGWTRESEKDFSDVDIDPRYLFATKGYNLRPTEVQAAFGIRQLEKLDGFVSKRRANAGRMKKRLDSTYFRQLREPEKGRSSWFMYPLLLREDAPFDRDRLRDHLEENGIETRPVFSGDITKHPVMEDVPHRTPVSLENTRDVHMNGLLVGVHEGMERDDVDRVAQTVNEFVEENS